VQERNRGEEEKGSREGGFVEKLDETTRHKEPKYNLFETTPL